MTDSYMPEHIHEWVNSDWPGEEDYCRICGAYAEYTPGETGHYK